MKLPPEDIAFLVLSTVLVVGVIVQIFSRRNTYAYQGGYPLQSLCSSTKVD